MQTIKNTTYKKSLGNIVIGCINYFLMLSILLHCLHSLLISKWIVKQRRVKHRKFIYHERFNYNFFMRRATKSNPLHTLMQTYVNK